MNSLDSIPSQLSPPDTCCMSMIKQQDAYMRDEDDDGKFRWQ